MNDTYRNMAILFEVERAIKYLRLGLAEIQNITPTNDFYDPLFIYLSGGLERLFKTMLCLNFKELNQRLPNQNEIWKHYQGHDLKFLKAKIERICIPTDSSIVKADYQVITENDLINSICLLLSEFGKRSRYFNLDAILGVEQEFDSKSQWEKFEMQISKNLYGKTEFYKLLEKPGSLDKIYADSNRELIISMEIFIRALTRQFIFGNFSSDSKSYWIHISDFSDIDDNQLGKTDYRGFKNHEFISRK